ncbi:protein Njmu-R1-like [Bacillus rossius redtenbacheri]|uniref:protein Njmu-R1-like n=1 Tax=Bacillus rossius redtenbacheri TaxID=93214 RepID=UPI002FDEDE6B
MALVNIHEKNIQETYKIEHDVVSHALYLYDKERLTESLSESSTSVSTCTSGFELVTTTLTADQDHQLQLFLMRRLRKGAIYAGTGNFSGMDFSLGEKPGSPAVCFYVLLPCGVDTDGRERQLVACLLGTADANLEAFRPELTSFCENLACSVAPKKEISSAVASDLTDWYSQCVQYVCRVLKSLGTNVAFLLQLAQQNGSLRVGAGVGPELAADARRFLSACAAAECLSLPAGSGPAAATLEVGGAVAGLECNAHCREWGRLLTEHGHTAEAWRIRRAMEAFKLKTIKDMNMLKRLLKQAEMDHYSLYRAYSFLWQSGNSDVLLEHAKAEGSSSREVIAALEEHIGHTLQAIAAT